MIEVGTFFVNWILSKLVLSLISKVIFAETRCCHPRVAEPSLAKTWQGRLPGPKLQICDKGGKCCLTSVRPPMRLWLLSYRWLACTALACEISDPREGAAKFDRAREDFSNFEQLSTASRKCRSILIPLQQNRGWDIW